MERKGQRQNQLRGEGGTRLGMFKTGGRGRFKLGGGKPARSEGLGWTSKTS